MVLLVSSHCEVRNHVKLHLQKAVQKTEVCHIKTKHLVNSLLSLDLKDDRRGIRSKSVSTTRMFPEVFSFAFTSSSSFSSSASSTEKLMSPPLFCKQINIQKLNYWALPIWWIHEKVTVVIQRYVTTKLLRSSFLLDSRESDSLWYAVAINSSPEIVASSQLLPEPACPLDNNFMLIIVTFYLSAWSAAI